jgi:two-component system, NarL family, response regulator LiaR
MSRQGITRLIIVDDHPCVRSGLAFSLSVIEDIQVVAEASTGEEAIALCSEEAPDVALMDLIMPGMGGIAAISALRAASQSIRIIAFSSSLDGHLVREALEAGAMSYVSKDATCDELVRAIRQANRDIPSLAAAAARSLVRVVASETPAIGRDLTDREREVLVLLAEGLSNQDIAARLVITAATVKFHTRSIRAKLGTTSRTQTVVVALLHRLVGPLPQSMIGMPGSAREGKVEWR